MKAGIIGLPKSGKTTLFNILTAAGRTTDKFSVSKEVHLGVATVPDRRLEQLRDIYSPKRYVPAEAGPSSAHADVERVYATYTPR